MGSHKNLIHKSINKLHLFHLSVSPMLTRQTIFILETNTYPQEADLNKGQLRFPKQNTT